MTTTDFPWHPATDPYIDAVGFWGRLTGVVYKTGFWRVYDQKRVYARGRGGREGCESALREIVKARYAKGRVVVLSAEKVAERLELIRRWTDG